MFRSHSMAALGAAMLCLFVLSAHAGINTWTIKGPPGGFYRDMVASSTDGNVFYAAYGRTFQRSVDGGNTWQALDFNREVVSIAVDPADGNRVYIAVIDEGVFRSTDGGQTFTRIAPTPDQVWAVGAGPNNVVYFANLLTFRRSADGGDTFGAPVSVQQTITQIVVDATDSNRVYALRGPFFLDSTDGGATWTEKSVGAGTFNSLYSLVKLQNGTLVLATSEGIYTSGDDGVTWNLRIGIASFSVAVDPSSPDTVIMSAQTPGPVYRSTDSGTSWSPMGASLPRAQRRALVSRSSSNKLVIANAQGVQLSDNGGTTWKFADQGPIASSVMSMASTAAANSRVYVYTGETTLYSTQNDSSWTRLGDSLNSQSIGQASLAVKPGDPNTLYFGAVGQGIYRSSDGGASWTLPTSGFSGYAINSIGFDPVDPRIVYAAIGTFTGTPTAGLYRSTDGGATWSPHSTNLAPINAFRMAVDPANGSRLFLAGLQGYAPGDIGGLYSSGDAGVTWTRNAFPHISVYGVALDPADSNRVYATTPTGLQVSNDGGTTFAPSDSFALISSLGGGDVAVDPTNPQIVYASSFDDGFACCAPQKASGIFRSVDRGVTWETLRSESDFPSWIVNKLLLDPNTPSRIYVATGLRGVAAFEVVNDLALTLSNHSGIKPVGSPSTFDLRVQHFGALAATGVRLVTTLPAGLADVVATTDRGACSASGTTLTCSTNVLRPGQEMNVHVTYTPVTAMQLPVASTLSAHENDDQMANNTAQATTLAGEVVDLGVTATVPTSTIDHGDKLTYTVVVNNAGPSDASEATLVFSVPDGLTLGAAPAGCTTGTATFTCVVGALTVGSTNTFELPATAQGIGSLIATATVTAAISAADIGADNNTVQSTIVSKEVADLSVSMTDSADPVLTNTSYTYTVTIRNEGPDDASGITATIAAPGTVSTTVAAQGSCTSGTGSLQCDIGNLAAGSTTTVTVTTASSTAGTLNATATVASPGSDRATGNNSVQQSTTVNAPAPPPGNNGGGGGGGAFDLATLLLGLLLTPVAAMRRLRAGH